MLHTGGWGGRSLSETCDGNPRGVTFTVQNGLDKAVSIVCPLTPCPELLCEMAFPAQSICGDAIWHRYIGSSFYCFSVSEPMNHYCGSNLAGDFFHTEFWAFAQCQRRIPPIAWDRMTPLETFWVYESCLFHSLWFHRLSTDKKDQ